MIPRLGMSTKMFACAAGLLILASATLTRAASAKDASITGRVLDSTGAPVAGATVEVVPQIGRWQRLRHRLDDTEPSVAARTITGDDGRFELPAQPPGLWILRVRADGMHPAERSLLGLEGPQLVELLTTTGSFSVRVVDGSGSPVAGAEVDAWVLGYSGDRWQHLLRSSLRTGDDGRVELPLPRSDRAHVAAVARLPVRSGLSTATDDAATWLVSSDGSWSRGSGAEPTMTLRFPDRPELRRIRFVRQGKPLAGVAVVDLLGPRALAGDDGVALVQSPSAEHHGGLDVRVVSGDRSLPWPTLPATEKDETSKQTADAPAVDIEVPPVSELQGRVTAPDGTPIENAWIASSGHFLGEPQLAFSDRDGVFVLPDELLDQILLVRADGYRPATLDTSARGLRPGTFPDVVLRPATSMTAWVVDDTHRPVRGVQVEILRQHSPVSIGDGLENPMLRPEMIATSDEQGRLTLSGLEPGARILVELRHEDFADTEVRAVVPESGAAIEEPTWVLNSAVRLSGRVVNAEGEPAVGATVALLPRARGNPRQQLHSRQADEPNTAETDSEGKYVFARVGAGPYQVEAIGASGGRGTLLASVQHPGPVELDDLELSAGARLHGRVTDEAGDPVPGLVVMARAVGDEGLHTRQTPQATTAGDGTFEITGLSLDRSVHVSAFGEDFRIDPVTRLPPFSEPVELIARRGGRVSGRVVDEDGEPVDRGELQIRVTQSFSNQSSTMTTSRPLDGTRFEQGGLEAGQMTVTVSVPDGRRASYRAELAPGQTIDDIELVLRAGVEVSGRVLSADGEPVIGSSVRLATGISHDMPVEDSLFAADGAEPRTTRTDAEGRFRFAHVEPGPSVLSVVGDDHPSRHDRLAVGTEPSSHLEIVLEDGREVDGMLGDGLGRPLAGATIRAVSTAGQVQATTDAEGRFTLPYLDPDTRGLNVQTPGGLECFAHQPLLRPTDGILRLTLPAPAADAVLQIRGLSDAELTRTRIHASASQDSDWGCTTFAEVGADGVARLVDLPAGRWLVRVDAGDASRRRSFDVEEGAGSRFLSIDFSGEIELKGSVLVDGRPLQQLSVSLENDGGASHSVMADSSGRFRISGVEPGSYRLILQQASTRFRHTQPLELFADDDIALDLRTSLLRGRVRPAGRWSVHLHQGESVLRSGTLPTGEFELRTALVGPAVIEVFGRTGRASADVTLVPGAEIEVPDLVLRAADR